MSLAAACTAKGLFWKRNLRGALASLLKLNTPSDLLWKEKKPHQNKEIKSPNLFCAKQMETEVNTQDRTVQLKERDKAKEKLAQSA